MILGRKKLRLTLVVITAVVCVFTFVEVLSTFQLNKEIEHYKYIMKKKKNNPGFFDPINIKQIPYASIENLHTKRVNENKDSNGDVLDWNKFAYVNYVADAEYLCNTNVMFKKLLDSGTKAKLVLLITSDLLEESNSDIDVEAKLQDLKELSENQVLIKQIEPIYKPKDGTEWNNSLSKLLVFNETTYDRVVYMDNDALLRGETTNLDELFFLPSYIDFAAPLTYWLFTSSKIAHSYHEVANVEKWSTRLDKYIDESFLSAKKEDAYQFYNGLPNLPPTLYLSESKNIASEILESTSTISLSSTVKSLYVTKNKNDVAKFASNLMVIKPSQELFDTIYTDLIPRNLKKKEKYDMDVINEDMYDLKKIIYYQFKLFKKLKKAFVPNVLVLPAREYGLLSGSLRNPKHYDFLKHDCIGYYDGIEKDAKNDRIEDIVAKWNKYTHFSDYPMGKPWYYSKSDDFECEIKDNLDDTEGACKTWQHDFRTFITEYEAVC